MHPEELKRVIEEGLSGAEAQVAGDGRHFEAVVIHEGFAGKGSLERHRMVYGALGDRFQSEAVHALSLKTYTREEWQQAGR